MSKAGIVAAALTTPDSNYEVSFGEEGSKDKFIITPYALIITAKSFSKTYGEPDPAFTEDFEGAFGETVNLTYIREAGSNADTYSFIAVALTYPNNNYSVSFAEDGGKDKFNIHPYRLVITASIITKTYGGAEPELTEDFDGVNGETVTVTYIREQGENAGAYSLTDVLYCTDNNYAVSFAEGGGRDKFIIEPKELVLVWDSPGLTYNDRAQRPAVSIDTASLIEGDVCDIEVIGEVTAAGVGYRAEVISVSNPDYKLPEVNYILFDIKPYTVDPRPAI